MMTVMSKPRNHKFLRAIADLLALDTEASLSVQIQSNEVRRRPCLQLCATLAGEWLLGNREDQ